MGPLADTIQHHPGHGGARRLQAGHALLELLGIEMARVHHDNHRVRADRQRQGLVFVSDSLDRRLASIYYQRDAESSEFALLDRSSRQVVGEGLDRGRTAPVVGDDPVTAWAEYALDARVMLLRDGWC